MGLSNVKNFLNLCKVGKRGAKSHQKLRMVNEKKIKEMVKFAYKHSVFYHVLYDNHNIDINNFSVDDLPVITKKDILDNYDQILTDSRLSKEQIETYVKSKSSELLLGEYGVFSSGGSSGVRCHIPYDEKSMYMLNALTLLRSGLIKPSVRQRIAFLGGVNHTNNTKNLERNGFFKKQFQVDTIPLFLRESEVVRRLNSFQPTTIAAYSYMLRNLAVKQLNNELHIRPSRMRCGGTPLSENDRAIILKAFGVLPFENYGASEALLIASECNEHQGMHINEDCYCIDFYEPFDRDGILHAKGILITNPNNKVFPLIRYKLDDEVMYTEEQCKCGCGFRRILKVEGRENENFFFGQGKVSPIDILNRIYNIVELDECRLVQKEYNQLEIRIVFSEKGDSYNSVAEQIYKAIVDYLNSLTNGESQVKIGFYNELIKDQMSGKLVPFITQNKWGIFANVLETDVIFRYPVG